MKTARDYSPASWRRVITIRERLERFLGRRGYDAIATPVLENTDLFLRKSGGELAARMYSFTDPSGRRVSLRPEFTSSVVRAFVEGGLKGPLPLRLQYAGTVFRYEGPDVGSLEFQQLGAELIGVAGEFADAEVLALAVQGLTALGVTGHRLRIGHVGVVNAMLDALGLSERARVFVLNSFGHLRNGDEGVAEVRARAHQLGLLDEGEGRRLARLARGMEASQAEEMVEGFLERGVTGLTGQRTPEEIYRRYLKKLREGGIPEIVEKALTFSRELVALTGAADKVRGSMGALVAQYGLPESVLAPLDKLLAALALYDLKGVPVVLDLGMARGLAYYTGMAFDIDHPLVNRAPGLGGGGRYDGLVKALGSTEDVPALGFAYAVEPVLELLPPEFGEDEHPYATRVLVTAQEIGIQQAVTTAERLRAQGIPAELDLQSHSDMEAAKYAKQRGISTVMRVGADGGVNEREV
ncbi:MAG: HisS family protein [Dehalococcoidia bacterium]